MSLINILLPPLLTTSSNNIIEDFFIPILEQSTAYDRGVGFFSSGWFRIAAKGMAQFAANGGHARWVTSPILDHNDWEALFMGDAAREDALLYQILKRNINDLSKSLENDTLSAISWMVADGVVEFKLALPRNKLDLGEFHDKFGIFTDDEGNKVIFNGSYNDSIQGTRNYESIKVFCSWEPTASQWIKGDIERFENLWNNQDPNVRIYNLPEAAREDIVRQITGDRPYPNPAIKIPFNLHSKPIHPQIPSSLSIRDYQKEAIQAWFDASCHGLFEMATGTGKTITALSASIRLFQEQKRLAIIVACPYQHLVDQWVEEAERFGFLPINAYKSKNSWIDVFFNFKLEPTGQEN